MEDGHDLKADLVILLQTFDLEAFKKLLWTTSMKFTLIADHNNANLFHDLAILSLPSEFELSALQLIIASLYRLYEEKALEYLRKLLNEFTSKEGETPLMAAVRSNKLILMREYIKLGADFSLKNKALQTIAHIAAEQGYYHMLIFIKFELEIDMEQPDIKCMTPLHLAIRNGRESVVGVLVAWGINLGNLDCDGNSLLHMAAISDSYRVAKLLLLRGIERDVKNNEGNTAFDISKSKCNKKLIQILDKPVFCVNLNPFKPPLTPLKNSYKLFTMYVLIFILRYVCVAVFLLPRFAIELSVISLVIFIVNFVLFLIVHQKDPGFIKRKRGINTLKLFEKSHFENVCPFCEVRKDITTYHCHHCERCVAGYDHHCPWIRNCVGRKNYKYFFSFLTVCCLDFLYTSVLGLLDYLRLLQKKRQFFDYKVYHKELGLSVTIVCAVCFLFAFPIWILHIVNFFKKQKLLSRSHNELMVSVNSISMLENQILS